MALVVVIICLLLGIISIYFSIKKDKVSHNDVHDFIDNE